MHQDHFEEGDALFSDFLHCSSASNDLQNRILNYVYKKTVADASMTEPGASVERFSESALRVEDLPLLVLERLHEMRKAGATLDGHVSLDNIIKDIRMREARKGARSAVRHPIDRYADPDAMEDGSSYAEFAAVLDIEENRQVARLVLEKVETMKVMKRRAFFLAINPVHTGMVDIVERTGVRNRNEIAIIVDLDRELLDELCDTDPTAAEVARKLEIDDAALRRSAHRVLTILMPFISALPYVAERIREGCCS